MDKICINYDVYGYNGQLVESKKFEDNCYEVLGATYIPKQNKVRYIHYDISRVDILNSLALGVNPFTGETSTFIDEKTAIALLDIANNLTKKAKEESSFKVKLEEDK